MTASLETFSADVTKAAEDASDSEQVRAGNAHVSMGFKVVMKEKSLDLPSLTIEMQRRALSLKLPQLTMAEKAISFDVVSMDMVNRQVGVKPRVVRRGLRFTVSWDPIFTKVPEFRKNTKQVSLKLPQVAMRNTTGSFSLPQVTMKMHRRSLKLPEFTSECWEVNHPETCTEQDRKRVEREVADVQARVETSVDRAKKDAASRTVAPVKEYFACEKERLLESSRAAVDVFSKSIAQIEATQTMLRAEGADDTAEAHELARALQDLRTAATQQSEASAAALAELDKQEQQLVASLGTALESTIMPETGGASAR